jgi:hypothetical protein
VATVRPSWQIDTCPSWCVGGHRESDHPDDRQHRSASTPVPVVVRRTTLERDGLVRAAEAAEFEVGLSRADGEPDTWLYVGEGPGASIELSAESARRLLAAAAERVAAGP